MLMMMFREYWRPWLFGVALPLVFCLGWLLLLAAPDDARFGPLEFWLRRYQALIAGLLGLAGGVIAFVGVRLQERSEQERWSTDRRLEMIGLAALIENDLRAWIPRIDEIRVLGRSSAMELHCPQSILETIPRLHRLRVPGTTLLQAIGFISAHNRLIYEEALRQPTDAKVIDELRESARRRLAMIRDMSTEALDQIHQITSSEHRFRI